MFCDITQEFKNADEIGFSCCIGTDDDIEPGQLYIKLRKTFEIFHMDMLDWHMNSACHRQRYTKRRYWSGGGKKTIFLKGNPKEIRIHYQNCVVEIHGKGYPDQIRYEQNRSRYGKPEYLDDGTEQNRPQQHDREETIKGRVEAKKEKRPSNIHRELEEE
jgi:hypothetical protein